MVYGLACLPERRYVEQVLAREVYSRSLKCLGFDRKRISYREVLQPDVPRILEEIVSRHVVLAFYEIASLAREDGVAVVSPFLG